MCYVFKLRACTRPSTPADENRENGGHEGVLPWLSEKRCVGESVQAADAERKGRPPVENLKKYCVVGRILEEIEDS
jgi:hypothetical protein